MRRNFVTCGETWMQYFDLEKETENNDSAVEKQRCRIDDILDELMPRA